MECIVHCGFGKTGTTSIQTFLNDKRHIYLEKGYLYCGMYFDSMGKDKPWKQSSATLLKLDSVTMNEQLIQGFEAYKLYAKQQGCHTMILSNESFGRLLRSGKILPFIRHVFSRCQGKLLFYVRHPASWVFSAYQQWGIKHKTRVGKVASFRQYYMQGAYRVMTNTLSRLNEEGLMPQCEIRKLEDCDNKDVVRDFLQSQNIPVFERPAKRTNESLDEFDETFFYLFNNRIEEKALPKRAQAYLAPLRHPHKCEKFRSDVERSPAVFDETIASTTLALNEYLETPYVVNDYPNTKINKIDARVFNLIDTHTALISRIISVGADNIKALADTVDTIDDDMKELLNFLANQLRD